MFKFMKKNKIPRLDKKTGLICNDIKIEDLNIPSILTVVSISVLFVISIRLVMAIGTL